MKCCGSPIISTAADAAAAAAPEPRAVVDAVLFSQILKPLAASLGPLGDSAVDSVARSLFVRAPR